MASEASSERTRERLSRDFSRFLRMECWQQERQKSNRFLYAQQQRGLRVSPNYCERGEQRDNARVTLV